MAHHNDFRATNDRSFLIETDYLVHRLYRYYERIFARPVADIFQLNELQKKKEVFVQYNSVHIFFFIFLSFYIVIIHYIYEDQWNKQTKKIPNVGELQTILCNHSVSCEIPMV